MKDADFFCKGTADPLPKMASRALLATIGTAGVFALLSCPPALCESSTASLSPAEKAKPEAFKTDTSKPFVRVDFQLTGVSCVSCVRNVARNLKGGKGIVKADVSIFPPHWSVVIIDTKAGSVAQVVKLVRKARADVTRLETVSLDSVPVIVVPKAADGNREAPHS